MEETLESFSLPEIFWCQINHVQNGIVSGDALEKNPKHNFEENIKTKSFLTCNCSVIK